MALPPRWYPLWKQHSESQGHLLITCNFARTFWHSLFSWHTVLPEDPKILLSHTIRGNQSELEKIIYKNYIYIYIKNMCLPDLKNLY